jgi:hypothetical protein
MKIDANRQNYAGQSPLDLSITGFLRNSFNVIIKRKEIHFDSHKLLTNGHPVLSQCILNGWGPETEAILQMGADPNCRGQDQLTPLHLACQCQNFVVVEKLISNCANISAKDIRGDTPLHTACNSYCSVHFITALTNAGADPHLPNNAGAKPADHGNYAYLWKTNT